ncbi:MAG TPA: deoxyribodipyrimidine photo-lyase [bacterium]|nr:deoxyribodipyrimidine photo-lyase [bacterium]HPR89065.1 deoxyribodipyrimidine photo-lyase [bacterium]
MARPPVTLFWFRRDLRLEDNRGLCQALRSGYPVLPLFIFDRDILDPLSDRQDRRVAFIHQVLQSLQARLAEHGSGLLVRQGRPVEVWRQLLEELTVQAVYTNCDYEPYAIARDRAVATLLAERGIAFHEHKDQVVFDTSEVSKEDGAPYTVYTPFKNRWLARLTPEDLAPCDSAALLDHLVSAAGEGMPSLPALGFAPVAVDTDPVIDETIIRSYERTRDLPGVAGTTRLSVHLRFGTVSIRRLAALGRALNPVWLQELIWREFFMTILARFPYVVNQPFKRPYAAIPWREDRGDFARWCAGETGYPIVDAGMRELNATGFMHNRVRMVTASFLCKHLLLPWQWGESYFAAKLLDYDLAANNGNWQWAAGCGCDAAPYFRVFNPEIQAAKFDPQRTYIRRWVPEVDTPAYPKPMVPHAAARIRALETYAQALRGTRE